MFSVKYPGPKHPKLLIRTGALWCMCPVSCCYEFSHPVTYTCNVESISTSASYWAPESQGCLDNCREPPEQLSGAVVAVRTLWERPLSAVCKAPCRLTDISWNSKKSKGPQTSITRHINAVLERPHVASVRKATVSTVNFVACC
jgi:hypothetical protein